MSTEIRKGQGTGRLDRAEFARRFHARFADPAFDAERASLARIETIAWEAYADGPRRQVGGRRPRLEPAHVRVRPSDPSVQRVRVDGHAALPLAVLLLSPPRARPDAGLDERDLRAVDARPRAAPMASWCTATSPASRTSVAISASGSNGWGWSNCGFRAKLVRYIGYYESYATSHDALDRDAAPREEVRNVVRAVAHKVTALRSGALPADDRELKDPRPK